jgi:Chaperone of endosialidase
VTCGAGTSPTVQLVAAPSISGANVTSGTVPNAALVTPALTSLTCSANVTCGSGTTTPTVQIVSTPSVTGLTSANGMTSGSSTYGPTSATVNGLVTGNGFTYPGSNVAANALTFPNLSTTGTTNHTTSFTTTGGASVAGIANSVWSVADNGNIFTLAQDGPGNLGIAGTIYSASERRLKNNIIALAPQRALELAMATSPVRFCYKVEHCKPGETRHIGFIADDTSVDLAPGHKSMDVNATAMVALASVAALEKQNAKLAERIAHLEAALFARRVMHSPSWRAPVRHARKPTKNKAHR